MNEKISSGTRWALVTFALGIMSGVLGHYLPIEGAFFSVLVVSVVFALAGTAVIADT